MQHLESMGDKWFSLGVGPQDINGVIATTLELGGTRPSWGVKDDSTERMLMAWPSDQLLRTSVVVAGEAEGQLAAVAVAPFMEGFANELAFRSAYAWKGGHGGEIAAQPQKGLPPLWFYDPLYFRDIEGLAEGEVRTYYLSGLCFGLRRALLDEFTVTDGPQYEAYAKEWMKANPTKSRLDVPALKIPLKGKTIIDITERFCEYQCRANIFDVDSFNFGPEGASQKIYRFGIAIGDPENPVYLIMYAPERVCIKGYVPAEGDDVDMIFWMQGRIADAEGMTADPEAEGEVVIPEPNKE